VTLRRFASIGLFALLTCPLAAQSSTDRQALRALADSAADLSLTALTSMANATGDHLRGTPRDPVGHLRLGVILLRLGQLGDGRKELDRAEAAFDEAAYRAPEDWPWPWYQLARAKLALAERGAIAKPSMHQQVGDSYRSAAFKSLARALEADSTFAPAAALLAEELLPLGERDLSGELQRAARNAAGAGAGPDPALAYGRVLRNLHQPDSALASFQAYVELGGDSGVGLLEAARSLRALERTADATRAYLAGADAARDAGRASYRADIAWVASPAELVAFDSLPGDSVGAWIHRFWDSRDAEELRGPGERLAEHLRRWNHVFAAFRLPPMPEWRTRLAEAALADGTDLPVALRADLDDGGPGTAVVNLYTGSMLAAAHGSHRIVDDRASLYMRHGEPDAHVITIARAGGIPAGLSWKYNTTTGPLLFHFGCENYCLLSRMPPSFDGLIELDVRYERLAASMRTGRADALLVGRIVRSRVSNLEDGLTTDGFAPRYGRQLNPLIQVFAVGDPARGTAKAIVVFAIPADGLTPTAVPAGMSGVAYRLAMRLIAANARGMVHRIDTTRMFRAADTLRPGSYLFALAEVPLDAGQWDVRALFAQPGTDRGGAAGRLGLSIPAAEGLALSDLVLGREGSGLVWRSPDGPVPLNPLDAYSRKATAEVYYEARGLVPGARYRTTFQIEGVSGDADGEVSLSFEEPAANAWQSFRRSVDLERLEGGQYRLTVVMEEAGGTARASSARLVNVLR
jgi:tetratricopeptide (TPR) repeat protein